MLIWGYVEHAYGSKSQLSDLEVSVSETLSDSEKCLSHLTPATRIPLLSSFYLFPTHIHG